MGIRSAVQQQVQRRWHGSVSMFWIEKWLCLHRFLQIQALIIVASQPWLWPPQWYTNMGFALLFNGDVVTFFKVTFGVVMPGAAIYATLMANLPLIQGAVVACFHYKVHCNGDVYFLSRHDVDRIAMNIASAGTIPVLLNAAFVIGCKESRLAIDHSFQCGTPLHVSIVVLTCVSALLAIAALPIYMGRILHRSVVYYDSASHERYLRSREVEYLLGVTDLYRAEHFQWTASFTRRWSYYGIVEHVQSVLLVGTMTILGPTGINWPMSEANMLTAWILIPVVARVVSNQYRCASSNVAARILDCAWIIDCLIIVSTASRSRNSLLVPATLNRILVRYNGVVVACYFAYMAYLFWEQKRVRRYATPATTPQWPTTQDDIKAISAEHPDWVAALQVATRLLRQCEAMPEPFLNAGTIEEMTRTLDKFRRQAHDCGHVLEWTLYDHTENVAAYAEIAKRRSILTNSVLIRQVDGLGDAMKRKSQERLLMTRVKVDLLQKLLVLRMIVSDQYAHGDRAESDDEGEATLFEEQDQLLDDMFNFEGSHVTIDEDDDDRIDNERDRLIVTVDPTSKLSSSLAAPGRSALHTSTAGEPGEDLSVMR